MAVANYHDAHGRMPPAYVRGPDGRKWHSWRVLILPYIEEGSLSKEYNFLEPWDGPNNRRLAGRMPRMYSFSSDRDTNRTTAAYLAVVGGPTAWPGSTGRAFDEVTDGLGSTMLFVENRGANVPWLEPRDLDFDGFDTALGAPGGVSAPYDGPAVVTLDGRLHSLKPGLRPDALRALLTARGGESLDHGDAGWTLIDDGRLRPLAKE